MEPVLKKMVQFKSQELGVDITEEYKESLQKELVPLIERDEKNAIKEKVAQLWLLFCGDELGIVNSRIAIALTIDFLNALLFSKEYSDFGASQRLLLRQLLEGFLRAGNSRVNSLETFIASARELIADLFEFDEEWSEAARVLGQIPLDSGHRSVSNQEKIRIYIKIMRLLLEADDPVSASVYVNRAALLIDLTKDSQDSIQFKSCQARILDSNRAFLKAAWKYFELSCNPLISEEDRLITL